MKKTKLCNAYALWTCDLLLMRGLILGSNQIETDYLRVPFKSDYL